MQWFSNGVARKVAGRLQGVTCRLYTRNFLRHKVALGPTFRKDCYDF